MGSCKFILIMRGAVIVIFQLRKGKISHSQLLTLINKRSSPEIEIHHSQHGKTVEIFPFLSQKPVRRSGYIMAFQKRSDPHIRAEHRLGI